MKKFIFKIAVFLAPIILLGYGLDVFLSTNLKKSNSFAFKEYSTWNAILEGKLNADILIYGSSRAWVHFDPKIIEDTLQLSTYNLGVDGNTFNMQYLRHQLALKHNKKPKLIIHSVDATTLQKGYFFNSEQILPYMLWDNDFQKNTIGYRRYSLLDYNLPLLRYYGETAAISSALKLSFSTQDNDKERIKGYQGQDRTWNNDFDNAKKIMTSYEVKIDEDLVKQFDNYINECKNNDIEVVLVYAPVYLDGQVFIQNQDAVIEMYERFAENYNIKFLDFTKDEICHDKDYFYNATHMNVKGSERFSKKLASKIKIELYK